MTQKLMIGMIAGALAVFSGCSQNGGSGSSGNADRTAQPAGHVPGQSNAEKGEPPGSRTGGNGPAPGASGAGGNPGAERNGESGSRSNPNPPR